MTLSRRMLALGAVAAPAVRSLSPAYAQTRTRLRIAHTASSDWSSIFLAREDGLFEKRGIDVDFVLVPVSSAVPAAIQSGSVQIGGATPPNFLQAAENGLDLVAIAGASVSTPGTQTAQYAVRNGVAVDKPADFAGKRVGTPGFGSVLDVLFRTWLTRNGVELRSVTFVETPFPSQADVLRGGSVDAVVTAEPILTRIVSQNIGWSKMFIQEVAPPRTSMTMYLASRQFATNNPAVVTAFREAIVEAQPKIHADLARSRQVFSRIIRLPPEVARNMTISDQAPRLTEEQMNWWVDTMMEQRLLRAKPNLANLMLPWPGA